MPRGLNYASLEQVSAWRFLRHRAAVAIGRRNVRLVHDPSKNSTAALAVGVVAAVLILGICAIVAWIKPVGQVGRSQIVADRSSGAIYVNVGGVMHPALNLASARLIAGSADNPTMVPMSEILKLPVGPMVGILGAPNDLSVRTPGDTGWALCDKLGSTGSLVIPRVTVIDGIATMGDWAQSILAPQAALMTYGGAVFLVTDGHRSEIDLADKPVTLALGLPVGDLHPAAMSRALYEALTPTAPLRVPDIPNPGAPVGYSTPSLPLVSGSVMRVSDVTGDPEFFVALPAGVQRVPQTVATMIINASLIPGAQVLPATSAAVATLPQATGFDVSIYPPGAVRLLDKSVEPVTCVMWRKTNGEPQAQVTTVSSRRLPIPVGDERRVIPLVSAGAEVADEVYVTGAATNFVQVTGVSPTSTRGESLWFVGDNGVRYGIPTVGNGDEQTLHSLGLKDTAPTPAPWAVIRWLPAGPALSKAAALSQHDTLPPNPYVAALPTPKSQPGAAGS
jgi:type VII secretion protein EccB